MTYKVHYLVKRYYKDGRFLDSMEIWTQSDAEAFEEIIKAKKAAPHFRLEIFEQKNMTPST